MGADGKLASLVWLLREHGEALEADFQHYYHIDLLGLWRGELTPRRVSALARKLPFGCQTWLEIGSDAAWSTETHMMAHVVDVLAGANWQRGGGKGKAPTPIDRPSDMAAAAAKVDRTFEKAARAEARLKRKKQQAPQASPPSRPRDARGRFVRKEA